MLPYALDSNVTKLLANLLTKPSVFYYLPIVSCIIYLHKNYYYYYHNQILIRLPLISSNRLFKLDADTCHRTSHQPNFPQPTGVATCYLPPA